MKTFALLILTGVLLITGCESREQEGSALKDAPNNQTVTNAQRADLAVKNQLAKSELDMKKVSLDETSKAYDADAAFERKILRDAQLQLEVTSPTDAQRTISSLAEVNGGFVVTSEAKQRSEAEPTKRVLDIKLVVRVPANQFDKTVTSIEGLATNVIQRNVTGQDVTEEFIDLEARIKTQKALELQFLEIMKRASKVEDALEVQRQIAEVRGEIEKLEGRKRFLENRSSLSTITIELQAPRPITVATSGFGRSVRDSLSDGLSIASALFLFLIRLVIVMVPITLFILLPASLLIRFGVRRARRVRIDQTFDPTPTPN